MRTRLQVGALVKIWHSGRGHEYFVAGTMASGHVVLIKNNCINKGGEVHRSATQKSVKFLPVSVIATEQGDQLFAQNINRVTSIRPVPDVAAHIGTWFYSKFGTQLLGFNTNVYPALNPAIDNRNFAIA